MGNKGKNELQQNLEIIDNKIANKVGTSPTNDDRRKNIPRQTIAEEGQE